MTTLRQIEANQRNGTLSTGPRTESGLDAASLNAVTHGLSAKKFVPADDLARIAERLEKWRPELKPEGDLQEWQARQYVAASVRIDRCEAAEADYRSRLAERAADEDCWIDDRTLD